MTKAFKTTVTIWSLERISPDIDIRDLACAVDNGDGIGLGSITCVEVENAGDDPEYQKMSWESWGDDIEDEDEDEENDDDK